MTLLRRYAAAYEVRQNVLPDEDRVMNVLAGPVCFVASAIALHAHASCYGAVAQLTPTFMPIGQFSNRLPRRESVAPYVADSMPSFFLVGAVVFALAGVVLVALSVTDYARAQRRGGEPQPA